ncbi:putative transcription factor interactor and regulator CCHC(Zn) family protein [Tanacetum coccineum]
MLVIPLEHHWLSGTENYNVWSHAMILALETKNKLGFINGKCTRSNSDELLMSQWDRCNSVVLSWILGSVTEELYMGQIFSKLAMEVWDELKETYDKIDGSVTFNLLQRIQTLKQNGAPVFEYYHKLNSLWRQYDGMIKLPECTCDANKKFKEHNDLIKLIQFLMGLDDVYCPIRSNISTRDPLPTVKTAFSIISREESHKGGSSNVSNKTHATSFLLFQRTIAQINSLDFQKDSRITGESKLIWQTLPKTESWRHDLGIVKSEMPLLL